MAVWTIINSNIDFQKLLNFIYLLHLFIHFSLINSLKKKRIGSKESLQKNQMLFELILNFLTNLLWFIVIVSWISLISKQYVGGLWTICCMFLLWNRHNTAWTSHMVCHLHRPLLTKSKDTQTHADWLTVLLGSVELWVKWDRVPWAKVMSGHERFDASVLAS